MAEVREVTETEFFHSNAEEYRTAKQATMLNFLECGKVLFNIKENLTHGMWLSFLEDVRVQESERTSQRMIAVYKDFRHILADDRQKTDMLTHLGMTHLLELKKLPDRFKKEIEVINDYTGEKSVVKVVDEDKLSDFLGQKVAFEGSQKSVGDLPLTEMKKYIKEAQGVFEPDDMMGNDTSDVDEENLGTTEIKKTENASKAKPLLEKLDQFIALSTEIMREVQGITYSDVITESDALRSELKSKLKKAISNSEGIIVNANGLTDRLTN